jgi:nitroreductase/Pyruvate/2-oxoacid:ferredoxin oxidoreductase delta subunit
LAVRQKQKINRGNLPTMHEVTTKIDEALCNGCGLCLQVCPCQTISLQDGKARVTGNQSLNCGHCLAVCPSAAISVGKIDEEMSCFANFHADKSWLPYGDFDTASLVRLMSSRRSCRQFLESPVDKSILEDLVKIGCTAPSATNCQMWTFTLLPTRAAVVALGKRIRDFYVKLNGLAEKSWLRSSLKLIGRPELDRYYRKYYAMVRRGMAEFDQKGRDLLFHGAPAAIVVACNVRSSLPADDALLASQNILLSAHSLGLGSCLIGLAVEAIKNDRSLAKTIGIPDDETVYAIIALGYTTEHYERWAGRQKPVMRVFTG